MTTLRSSFLSCTHARIHTSSSSHASPSPKNKPKTQKHPISTRTHSRHAQHDDNSCCRAERAKKQASKQAIWYIEAEQGQQTNQHEEDDKKTRVQRLPSSPQAEQKTARKAGGRYEEEEEEEAK